MEVYGTSTRAAASPPAPPSEAQCPCLQVPHSVRSSMGVGRRRKARSVVLAVVAMVEPLEEGITDDEIETGAADSTRVADDEIDGVSLSAN